MTSFDASTIADDVRTLLTDPVTDEFVTGSAPLQDTPDFPLHTVLRREKAEEVTTNPKIMIVDDEPTNVKIVRKYLASSGYSDFVTTSDSTKAWDLIVAEHPDLILLDIMMPEISGLELLEKIRNENWFMDVPVIILTAANDQETKRKAFELGATDFLAKPLDPLELVPRVRNTLVVKAHQDHLKSYAWDLENEVVQRTAELESAQHELVRCLAQAAEYRDNETGRHILRVGRYSGIIAHQLQLHPKLAGLIEQAAPLHDIGKIGIPDAILLKPGKLDPEEFEAMRQHCSFGHRIVEPMTGDEAVQVQSHVKVGAMIMATSRSPLLRVASRIALTHHERWDGKGYPFGISGEEIPIEGRIVAVADVFDALSSKRPYKPAFPREKCFAILKEGRGTQFDPQVLDAFFARQEEIIAVQAELTDEH